MLINTSLSKYLFAAFFFLGSLISAAENKEKSYFDCPCPHIIAHQGSSIELPPNTIEAYQLALDQGADIIELDIWRAKDGTWVVIHDENLSRITGVDREVTDLNFEELQLLDAGYNFSDSNGNYLYRNKGYKIPLLEEVFIKFDNEKINIEIKGNSKTGLRDLVELIKKYKMDKKILVVSSSYKVIKEFRKITEYKIATTASKRDIKRMLYFNRFPGYAYNFNAFQLPYYSEKVKKYGMINENWISEMQGNDLVVHYWTIDNSKDIEEAIAIGANGIITNKPKTVYDVLMKLGKR